MLQVDATDRSHRSQFGLPVRPVLQPFSAGDYPLAADCSSRTTRLAPPIAIRLGPFQPGGSGHSTPFPRKLNPI